jgi:SET domain-containing protein
MSDVVVGPSPIAELGVFAARPFAAGETVLLIDDSRTVDHEHPLQPARGEFDRHQDYLAGGRIVLMAVPERYINSSCDPNTYVATRSGTRHVIALRPISHGEEITYDYLINCDRGAEWLCHGGAARCRGLIPGSFFDLPPAEQRRLLPLLDGWFVAEHRARISRLGDRE